MIFSVCPHDIVKQLQTWLDMGTYLGRQLGEPVRLRQAMDFQEFYQDLHQSDMAFVNPMDAWVLHTTHGFLPIGRTELYDEVVFFAPAGSASESLEDLKGQPLGAVERQFATYLGLYLLRQQGIEPGEVSFLDSWIQVVRKVTRGEIPYGLLYNDFLRSLSSLSRSMIQVIYESETRYATHIFLMHPRHEALCGKVSVVLENMAEDVRGSAILQALRLGQWVPAQDLGVIGEIVTGGE